MTAGAREFLDTNILVYAVALDPRASEAEALLRKGCLTGVQALNEFANVARRKLGMSWNEVNEALASIRALCGSVLPLTVEVHLEALRLAQRHGFAIFDALMVASALQADCRTLWSEDMQHGMMIDGRLRIANPFRDMGVP